MSARRHTRWIVALAFWSVFAIVIATQTWLSMIEHGHSLPRMLVHQLATWWIWAAFTLLLFPFTRRVPIAPPRARNVALHLVAALALSSVHVLLSSRLTEWMRPYDEMTIVDPGPSYWIEFARLPFEFLIYAGVIAVAHAADFYRRAAQLERSLASARLHALELQIQPHFLFNTLNAISSLVRGKQNAEAVEVVAGLSDLLRYTLDHAEEQRVALEEEAAILKRYLDIQHVRFADRLDVRIDIAPETARAAVPTLLLQPLAENAIRHGVAQTASPSRVEVRAFRDDGFLRIEMFNTGTLREERREGIGLRNTAERLRQLYGDAHRFTLHNARGGVVTEIAIPWGTIA
ncbi:MAG TPA: histidine kinase [Thermoanaerobaculia bacterium]|nr:histidine kinase [Thermoanaerobaculia bacterium]